MGKYALPVMILFPFVCGGIGYLIGKKNKTLRNRLVAAATLVELAILLICCNGVLNGEIYELGIAKLGGLGLRFRIDGFRFLLSSMAMLLWAMCSLFSEQYFAHYHKRNRYYFFWMATLSATVGVFFSADLITAFVFFEIMSFTSYVFVAQEETEDALRAASTYLAVAVIGGLVMLMGLFLLQDCIGTLTISELFAASQSYLAVAEATGIGTTQFYIAGALILVGFGAKAGMFPLHIWLPKAHPVAPAPASAVLSGKLTKVGVFGILVVCCNLFHANPLVGGIILGIGLITMFLGALLALFSINFKRTLACSSVSQIGFILTGIGMQGILGEENAIAAAGTILHMLNHSLFKLVLFLVAGVIVQNLHALDLNDIRGFGRKKPYLMICYLFGALGIGGIPGWSGYISKTLLHEGIVEGIHHMHEAHNVAMALKSAEIVFLISGGITCAYMLKLFVAVFVEKNPDKEEKMRASDKKYLSLPGRIAIGIPAVLLFVFGAFPHMFYDRFAELASEFMHAEPMAHAVHYMSLVNLKGAAISIAVGAVVYFGIVRQLLMKRENGVKRYVDRWPVWLDIENLIYRPLLLKWLPALFGTLCKFFAETLPEALAKVVMLVVTVVVRLFSEGLDRGLLLLRKTLYHEKPTEQLYIGTRMTYRFGRMANIGAKILNRTVRRRHPITTDYVVTFAELHEINKRRNRMIESSLSYALLLFCVGMCITMIYLLFVS